MISNGSTFRERADFVRNEFPGDGLFKGKEWLISPDSFRLGEAMYEKLLRLGNLLHAFTKACNYLYLESARGNQPAWIAELLDRGKPAELVEFSRKKRFEDHLPAVIRPDLIIGEDGLYLTELDSLPGGIGVTAWMNKTYSHLGEAVIGGEYGMVDDFAELLSGGDVLISRESADYRPEMIWITNEIRKRRRASAGEYQVIDTGEWKPGPMKERAYRYFELWDQENVEHAAEFRDLAESGTVRFTPPFKPFLEEKLWLVLFWSPALGAYWKDTLGEDRVRGLQEIIPYGWVVDPSPIPPFGEIPRLGINSWTELGDFSQKERHLVLKISGFSEQAWGSHDVHIGHDLPGNEWKHLLEAACEGFETHPYVLQKFHKGKLVKHAFSDPETGDSVEMTGRVRLCPYYFVRRDEAKLSGIMATICWADKKLIHGMKDAILVPCSV